MRRTFVAPRWPYPDVGSRKFSGRIPHAIFAPWRRCEIPGGLFRSRKKCRSPKLDDVALSQVLSVDGPPFSVRSLERFSKTSSNSPTYRFDRTPFGPSKGTGPHPLRRRGLNPSREQKELAPAIMRDLVMRDLCYGTARTIGPYRVKLCKHWCLRRLIRFTFSGERKLHPVCILSTRPDRSKSLDLSSVNRSVSSVIFPSRSF